MVKQEHLQVQGLMEIFQREWCNIYLWTVNGSAIFHVPRDRQYWTACFVVLSVSSALHLCITKSMLRPDRHTFATL